MDNIQIEEDVQDIPQKLKEYLDKEGRMYKWLTDQMGVTQAWLTNIFNGTGKLTEVRKKQIEEILKIQLDDL